MVHTETHTDPDVESALIDLIAIVRDQQLGYRDGDLHKPPTDALKGALDALEAAGTDTDGIVFPDDKDALGLS